MLEIRILSWICEQGGFYYVLLYKDFMDYDAQIKAEGKAEGLLEAAKRLLSRGADPQYVADVFQLSDTQVEQLGKSIA
ncbi:MAG: hypothetical protein FWC73_13340 [Defluviitaleaceae bacterium]|nr:hypothetical protein [Defluviitaleaceae bacterium]